MKNGVKLHVQKVASYPKQCEKDRSRRVFLRFGHLCAIRIWTPYLCITCTCNVNDYFINSTLKICYCARILLRKDAFWVRFRGIYASLWIREGHFYPQGIKDLENGPKSEWGHLYPRGGALLPQGVERPSFLHHLPMNMIPC